MTTASQQRHAEKVARLEQQHGKPIRQLLSDLVEANELTYPEIAKLLTISPATLKKWLNRYQVQGRGSGNFPKRLAHKQNISKALTGQQLSPEHIQAQRQTKLAKGTWKPIGHTTIRQGYVYTKVTHGRGRNNYKPQHRIVAEQTIGRPLTPKEHVHHIDGNTLNNEPTNLVVLSKTDHKLIHAILHVVDRDFARAIILTLKTRFPDLD